MPSLLPHRIISQQSKYIISSYFYSLQFRLVAGCIRNYTSGKRVETLVSNDSKAQRPATNLEKQSEKKGQEEDGKRKVQFLYGVLALLAATVVSVDVKDFLESRSKPKQNILLDHAFAECQVTNIKQINHDTRLYKIRAKNYGEAAMPIPYHILIKDDSCQVARSYSPVTISDNFELGLVIKHYKDGIMSSMLGQVKLGESILVSGPICSMLVPYKENSVAELGMIAGGTGITPMYQLLKKILQSKTDKTKITLYYINKTPQDILLKKELDHFATNFPDRFKLVYALDSIQKKEDVLNYSLGRPTQESLKSILPSPSTSSCILICGPDGLIANVAGPKGTKNDMDQGAFGGILKKLGYSEKQVFKL